MTLRSKGFLLAAVIIVSAFAIAYLHGPPKPSDEELALTFENHRGAFSELERLFVDDPDLLYASPSTLERTYDGRWPASTSVTPIEYRSLFEKTATLSGFRNSGVEMRFLSFPAFRRRLTTTEDEFYEEKGYAVFLAPSERVEEIIGTGRMYASFEFKQIADRWYIYHRVYEVKPE